MGVVLNLFDVMEMIGIASFAISGAMVGIRKQLDFFGVLILGIVTAVGGGVLRDVIIGVTPPVMFRNPSYTVVASITAAIFFASRIRKRLYRRHHLFDLALFVTDTIGMAIFVVNGIQGAMNSLEWYNPFLLGFRGRHHRRRRRHHPGHHGGHRAAGAAQADLLHRCPGRCGLLHRPPALPAGVLEYAPGGGGHLRHPRVGVPLSVEPPSRETSGI